MRLIDWASKLSRRGFLAGGAATIAAVAVSGATILTDQEAVSAEEAKGLTAEQSRALRQFARDLFPHDRLDDSFYERAIAPLKDDAEKDQSTKKLLADGIAQLDRLSTAASGKPYAEAADEKTRVAVIKQIEDGPFFAKVYGTTINSLYNQPKVWPTFGYEGPSSALGGYTHRGFSDIDWL
jgi:hypothetical protein